MFTVGCYRNGKHKHKGVKAGGRGGEEVGCHGWRERLRGDLQVVSQFILNTVKYTSVPESCIKNMPPFQNPVKYAPDPKC